VRFVDRIHVGHHAGPFRTGSATAWSSLDRVQTALGRPLQEIFNGAGCGGWM
jgi:hypothetical protein